MKQLWYVPTIDHSLANNWECIPNIANKRMDIAQTMNWGIGNSLFNTLIAGVATWVDTVTIIPQPVHFKSVKVPNIKYTSDSES